MDVRITIKGVGDRALLRAHAEERVLAALNRFDDRIRKVEVRLEDVTGPSKSGVDKRCRIDVRLRSGGTVLIDELTDDMQAALAAGLDRLKAALGRRVSKRKRGVGAG